MPMSADQALASTGADAVLDGTQFDACDGLPYATSQCAYPDFLAFDQSSGVSANGLRPSDGVTIGVADGQAFAMPGSQTAPGATVAMQLWPALVVGSTVVADNSGSNATQEWRAALAIMSPDQLAFVIGPADMATFANQILQLGATDAGYTDGSYSAALATQDGMYGPTPLRRVPLWLVARPAVPTAVKAGLIATAIALGVGGLAWWWSKNRPKPQP